MKEGRKEGRKGVCSAFMLLSYICESFSFVANDTDCHGGNCVGWVVGLYTRRDSLLLFLQATNGKVRSIVWVYIFLGLFEFFSR